MADRVEWSADYALIGVGSLAEAIVTGLCADQTSPPRINLSPRSHARTARLAEQFPTVSVADDNQAAASSARTVLLCLRPQDAPEVMESIQLGSEQRVVSVMASLSMRELAGLAAPASQISRAIPSMVVASRAGFTPVFPAGSAADELFERLGGSMVLAHEHLIDAVSAGSATVASYFSYLQTISGWLADRGVEQATADRYIASIFAGVGAELVGISDLAPLAAAHATRGGLNERIEHSLGEAGIYDAVAGTLDEVYGSLTVEDPAP